MSVTVRFEIDGQVKAAGEFAGDGFIVKETAFACRANGVLVQAHSVNIASLDAGDLGGNKRMSIAIVLRRMLCPDPKLRRLLIKQSPVLLLPSRRNGRIEPGQRERMKE